MELQIQNLVSSIRKEGIEAANKEAEAIIAEAKKTVADTANDVVLLHSALVRDVAVRIGDRDDAVLLLDFARDSLLRRSFFTAHILAVGVAVACDFVTIVGYRLESVPVRPPASHEVKSRLEAVFVKLRRSLARLACVAVVKRKGCGALAEACPGTDFGSLGENGCSGEQAKSTYR